MDCTEVSNTELRGSDGAWLTSVGDSPGFLFFLMAASSAAPLPPDKFVKISIRKEESIGEMKKFS